MSTCLYVYLLFSLNLRYKVCCISGNINCARNRHRYLQLKLNIFVASLFQLQISITYTMIFSSLYLFVTSPTSHSGYLYGTTLNSSDTQVRSNIDTNSLPYLTMPLIRRKVMLAMPRMHVLQ